MNKNAQRLAAVVSILLFAVAAVAVNVLLYTKNTRFDLTRDKSLSVSPELEEIAGRITDALNVTLYVSPDLPPQLLAPRQTAEDMLRELASKVPQLRIAAVAMTNEEEEKRLEELERLGIEPQQMQVMERNQLTVRNVYFHMAFQHLDKTEVMEIPMAEEFEYKVARAVIRLTMDKRPVVAFIDNSPQKEFFTLASSLERFGLVDLYEPVVIDASGGKPIFMPPGVSLAVVSAPARLTPRQMYEIDQTLLSGVPVVALVGGEDYENQLAMFQDSATAPNFRDLVRHYGVDLRAALVRDWESSLRTPMEVGRRGGLRLAELSPNPIFPVVIQENISGTYPALRRVQRVLAPLASEVALPDPMPEGFRGELLLTTTEAGDTQTTPPFDLQQPAPGAKAPGETRKVPVAVILEGPFKSFFKREDIPPGEDARRMDDPSLFVRSTRYQPPVYRETAEEGAKLVVIGSPYAFSGQILQQISNLDPNLASSTVAFLQNLTETFSVGDDLTRIRSRRVEVSFLRAGLSEEERGRSRLLGTLAAPVGLALFGLAWGAARRVRLNSLAKEYAR
ncbi:MAG: GldG family protein [Candidatus Sumerlaeia bacterium]|nr:GldG family protein [Candidatus Sumerlaeia bacterium]